MKKVLLTLGLLITGITPSFAGLSDIGKDVVDNTRLTILQKAQIAYFYDLGQGNDKTSQGGVIDHIFTYRFLSLDMGWRNSLSGGNGMGVGGVGVQIDELVRTVAPTFVDYVNALVPASAQGFWKSTFVGIDTGWDTDAGQFRYAFHTGVSFPF